MKKDKIITLILFLVIAFIIMTLIWFIYNQNNKTNFDTNIKENNFEEQKNENNNLKPTNGSTNVITEKSTNENNDNTISSNDEKENGNSINNEKQDMENNMDSNKEIKVNMVVDNKIFKATFFNNETTKKLLEKFPMTLNMSELHSNEKYNYLDFNLPTDAHTPSRINAGDIKLYGNNCLVVFYKDFSNSYSYTDIGKIDNVNGLLAALGNGSVTIKFETEN